MKIEIKIYHLWFMNINQIGNVIIVNNILRQGPKRLSKYFKKVIIEDEVIK